MPTNLHASCGNIQDDQEIINAICLSYEACIVYNVTHAWTLGQEIQGTIRAIVDELSDSDRERINVRARQVLNKTGIIIHQSHLNQGNSILVILERYNRLCKELIFSSLQKSNSLVHKFSCDPLPTKPEIILLPGDASTGEENQVL